ncbi:MAG: CHAT domain-containing protein [Spirulina sp. SIO3F2]|nr:CHAT domain-containing protein [Spirulina sp. SIO3F2]
MIKSTLWLGGTVTLSLTLALPVSAQSITAAPDGTGTIINHNGNTYEIHGGTQTGANLFHSFQDFGLSIGEIANFRSNPSISNILGRVIGGNSSIIDGLIQANPNLYLMNPAGIVFGANASLNVGGDFLATTADQICFEGGCFNAMGLNDYATLQGNPTTLSFLQNQPGGLINAGTLEVLKGKSIHLSGGTVVNLGQIAAVGGTATIAAIPGARRVRLNQPGRLLSLEVTEDVLIEGIEPLALPELLAVAPESLNTKVISAPLGNVMIAGVVEGEQIDLYAAGQVIPSNADLIQGDTRVVRFSASGENPDQAVFIDARAEHPEDLLFGAEAGTVAQIIERDENGVSVISDQLAVISESVEQLESVAIVAEGNEGNFWLGNQWIRNENIAEYAAQLQTWGNALTENADILLYSCFTALGATGEALIASIADITGADVAASVDVTGSGNYGGDWQLEHSTDTIEANNPFTNKTVANWEGKLLTHTVDSLADDGSGGTTLREAIAAASSNDDITFGVVGTVTLNGTQLSWNNSKDNLTIDGNGSTVSGGNASRVFNITADNATLRNLTIQDGVVSGDGAAINRNGRGTLTLENVTITNNSASTRAGGIRNRNGTVALINSSISNNSAGSGGGAIFNSPGTVTLTDSTISGNSANGIGGGIWSNGTVTLSNSTVSDNTSNGTSGGGIFGNTGSVTLSNSTVSGNSVRQQGGGINVNSATLTLNNSTISGNTASTNGGGIFSINAAVTLSNSTVSGNSANGNGGGIASIASTTGRVVTLSNATIALNTASGNGGGIYLQNALENAIANTIIANNVATGTGPDIQADLGSSTVQFSLLTDTAGISGLSLSNGTDGNIISQDPMLGPLQNNGGATQTHALLTGSPAINSGSNTLSTATIDQTGNSRIVDNTVDIGTYESPETSTTSPTTTTPTVTPLTCDVVEDCAEDNTSIDPTDETTSTATQGQSTFDTGVEEIEAEQVNDFGAFADASPLTLKESQTVLKRIALETGVEPSLVYFQYVPSTIAQTPNPLIASANLDGLQLSQNTAVNPLDQLQVVLVTPDGTPIIKRPLGATRAQVAPLVRRFKRRLHQQSDDYLRPAQQLYDWLIRPLDPHLQALGIEHLSVIADTGLRSLPLAALHNGEQFLVEHYSAGMMPSLSLIDTRYRALNNPKILAMGAAEFNQHESLPAVPTELALITQGQSQPPLLNEAFTAANLQAQSRDRSFDILHLATHAVFRANAPDQAYVQLWGQESLQLENFRELKLYQEPALELLVLSACETALGSADAELGFAGASLQAGVKSVLASLWKVSDLGTMRLMTEFYTQLADPGVTIKAEALRQAQLGLLRGEATIQDDFLGTLPLPPELAQYQDTDLTHPYHWSAFTLVGSPW